MASEEPPAKKAKVQPKLQLFYFNLTGKGEPLRLAMRHAGLDFEDVRLSHEEFHKLKQSGELSFGQLPALKTGDGDAAAVLVQTSAIARYLGQLSGDASLYPKDLILAAKVDALMEQANDMMCGSVCVRYQDRFGFLEALGGPGGEGTAKVEKAIREEILPRHLGYFEAHLEHSKTGWLAGTEGPSVADFVCGCQIEWVRDAVVKDGAVLLGGFPKTVAFLAKLDALPAVRAWREQHAN